MAATLNLYAEDQTLYTDLDGDGKIDLYSSDSYETNTTYNDTSILEIVFNIPQFDGGSGTSYGPANLTPWVVSSGSGYELSIAPISGVVGAEVLVL